MTCHRALGSACLILFSLTAADAAAQATAAQAGAAVKSEATAAAKASEALVGELSKELGSTPEQAAGAAGALFSLAKSRLKADEFAQVSKAVPGMGALLSAAPALDAASGLAGMAKATGTSGSIGGLASAATAFSKLGLKPDLVAKAVPVLTSFVTKSGGADVGRLLAGVLK